MRENDEFHLEHYIETNITKSLTLSKCFILRDKVIQIYVNKLVGDTEYLVANNEKPKVCSGSCTVMISPSNTYEKVMKNSERWNGLNVH